MAAKQWGAAGSLETQPHVKWESSPDSALIVSGWLLEYCRASGLTASIGNIRHVLPLSRALVHM